MPLILRYFFLLSHKFQTGGHFFFLSGQSDLLFFAYNLTIKYFYKLPCLIVTHLEREIQPKQHTTVAINQNVTFFIDCFMDERKMAKRGGGGGK